jgi:hypothetical protein
MSIANHLLNFRYERPSIDSGHTPSGHYGPRRKSQLRSRPKESFLQTNFRFVLAPTAPPAHPAIYDADSIIDWCVERADSATRAQAAIVRGILPPFNPHPHKSLSRPISHHFKPCFSFLFI